LYLFVYSFLYRLNQLYIYEISTITYLAIKQIHILTDLSKMSFI